MTARSVVAAGLAVLVGCCAPFARAMAEDGGYALGPGDHLRVKIIEWRPSRGDSYDWPGLSGEFVVDDGGGLALPLVGRMSVAGKDVGAVGEMISAGLQRRVGLAQMPEAAVEVVQHRPFFIIGSVEKPSGYPYQPGMTVLEAVSLAGGFYRSPVIDREQQGIEARGTYHVLATDRLRDLASVARLETEVAGGKTIAFPPELLDRKSNGDVTTMLKEEDMLFTARRSALQSQLASFDQTKALLQNEIGALQARIASEEHQKSLAEEELANVSDLVAKGLVVLPRKLALEQSATQFESTILELRVSVVRAQQDIARASRDQLDLQNKFQDQDLSDLQAARQRLAEGQAKIATAQELAANAESGSLADQRMQDTMPNYRFEITRVGPQGSTTIAANDTDPVLPGDLIKVIMPQALEAISDLSDRRGEAAARLAQRDMPQADPLQPSR